MKIHTPQKTGTTWRKLPMPGAAGKTKSRNIFKRPLSRILLSSATKQKSFRSVLLKCQVVYKIASLSLSWPATCVQSNRFETSSKATNKVYQLVVQKITVFIARGSTKVKISKHRFAAHARKTRCLFVRGL